MIEDILEDIINEIHDMTGKPKDRLKQVIEELMAPDDDFNGRWSETYEIQVRSQEPDKYHYDIYLKVGSVWSPSWLKHKDMTPDYEPRGER